jgi:hypothetical protein
MVPENVTTEKISPDTRSGCPRRRAHSIMRNPPKLLITLDHARSVEGCKYPIISAFHLFPYTSLEAGSWGMAASRGSRVEGKDAELAHP